jgi:hypothetical protein
VDAEKLLRNGTQKTRIVTPPKAKDSAPIIYECYKCEDPILDKSPCGLIDVDGEKKVVCLKCKPKTKKELAEISDKLQ